MLGDKCVVFFDWRGVWEGGECVCMFACGGLDTRISWLRVQVGIFFDCSGCDVRHADSYKRGRDAGARTRCGVGFLFWDI
jgi:hypothetical protein